MSWKSGIEAGLLALACASALVAVAGVLLGRDALAKLIYSSIPGSTTLVFLAAAYAVHGESALSIGQVLLVVVLSVVGGGLAGNRIAGAIKDHSDEARPSTAASKS